MAEIDPTLLQSPYGDQKSPRRWIGPLVGALVVVGIIAAGLWAVSASMDVDPDEQGASESTPTTEIVVAPVRFVLAAFTPDPAVLTHPTLLPEGWELCSVTEDRFDPDRFCGDSADRWVEIRYAIPRPSDPESTVPAGIHDGEWTSQSDPLELRFPINEHVSAAVRSKGIDAEQTLEIADSIPLIGDRAALFGPYELPIDWESMTGDDLVDLLGQFEGDATVDLGRFELTVRTSNATLHGFNSRGYWTPDAATDLPMARIVETDRPLVVGASDELKRGYAVWDQAGFAWRLEGNLDADEATVLALSVIAKLADLPQITER